MTLLNPCPETRSGDSVGQHIHKIGQHINRLDLPRVLLAANSSSSSVKRSGSVALAFPFSPCSCYLIAPSVVFRQSSMSSTPRANKALFRILVNLISVLAWAVWLAFDLNVQEMPSGGCSGVWYDAGMDEEIPRLIFSDADHEKTFSFSHGVPQRWSTAHVAAAASENLWRRDKGRGFCGEDDKKLPRVRNSRSRVMVSSSSMHRRMTSLVLLELSRSASASLMKPVDKDEVLALPTNVQKHLICVVALGTTTGVRGITWPPKAEQWC